MINRPLSAEDKYISPPFLYERIHAILRHYCRLDRLYPRNRVFSIYYDTPSQTAFAEKTNGDFLKHKVRLRWYEDDKAGTPPPAQAVVYLESKNKVGGVRGKSRQALLLDAKQLRTASLEKPWLQAILAKHFREAGLASPGRWRPAIQIEYLRERYECPASGARVCVDSRIGCLRFNRQMIHGAAPVRLNTLVVEIKGVHNPDTPWLKHLHASGMRAASFSKYGACFAQLTGGLNHE